MINCELIIYNKLVSTNLLVKSIKNFWKEFNEDFSTLLFSRFIYLIFLNAKNYYYDSKLFVELNISDELIPNYKNVINCWNLIEDIFIQENKFVEEIRYARLFYLKIILCSLYSMQGMIKVKKIINNPIGDIANNHMMDYGYQGLFDTLENLGPQEPEEEIQEPGNEELPTEPDETGAEPGQEQE